MEYREMVGLTPDKIISRIGNGPYLIEDINNNIQFALNIQYVADLLNNNHLKSVYAYGYDKFDGKDYMNNEKLDKYYEQAAKEDMYIIVDENGPSFGSFDTIEYYVENGINNVMVNDISINEFYVNEMKKRMEKSDSIRR